MLDPIALAIPVFIALIGVELGVGWALGRLGGDRPLYRWSDALTNLACGVLSQVTGLYLSHRVALALYQAVFGAAPTPLDANDPLVWIGTFIAVDFLFYWWHRASHRVNALWAVHVVHHQSEDYNLAVALRQTVLEALTTIPFYLPLAIIGVPPLVFATCSALDTLYQFWIHTRLVGRLGPLEWVLNTPSHHRVHHGINPAYIDRNHAGVFIVWDRLFGTFTPEVEEPVYGTVEPFRSGNALWANVEPLLSLGRRSVAAGGWSGVYLWFAPPEWTPSGPRAIPIPTGALRWRAPVSVGAAAWTGVWFLTAVAALSGALAIHVERPEQALALGTYAAWTVVGYGLLFDGRTRAFVASEAGRIAALGVGLAVWASGST